MKTISLPILIAITLMLCGCKKTPPAVASNQDLYTNSYENELKLQLYIATKAYLMAGSEDAQIAFNEAVSNSGVASKPVETETFSFGSLTNYVVTNFWAQKAMGNATSVK